MTKEKLIKVIAEYIRCYHSTYNGDVSRADNLANQVLILVEDAGYVRLAEDQTLPVIHETGDYEQDLFSLHHEYFANSWRKVILEVGK